MFFFYSIGIKIYTACIYLASPFYPKAKKAVLGRKNFFKIHTPQKEYKFIWFHCASLGEFEQGRTLIEKIKREYPSKKILLSFFSPSGFEIRKNYECSDRVIYLPFDSRKNAKRFTNIFNIEMAIFVKYDVWPFYLKDLLNKRIPTYMISATFRKNHFYFKWYGRFIKNILKKLNAIYVQNWDSEKISKNHGFENVVVAGDLRIDRVLEIKNSTQSMEILEPYLQKKTSVIFGSIWPQDELVIDIFIDQWKRNHPIIIVPHLVSDKYVAYLQRKYLNSILLSDIDKYTNEQILIVNNIGLLNQLYKTAALAYIGGGFGGGIHNILEPAVYGIPVFFGPGHQNFFEAKDFIENNMGFSSTNKEVLAKMMINRLLKLNESVVKDTTKHWFSSKEGATSLIFNDLIRNHPHLFN